MIALASLLLGAVPVASSHLLFGSEGREWVVMNDSGVIERRLKTIGGHAPRDAALSPDGTRWAVLADDEDKVPTLFLFTDENAGKQTRIHSKGNVLDNVSFSPDGVWVYFSSNDYQQPTFKNQSMLYAQVWRARFGSGVSESVSMTQGCHLWPHALPSQKVAVSHATCTGGRGLDLLDPISRAEQQLVPPTANVGETAVDRTGQKLFYTTAEPKGFDFWVMSLPERTSENWGSMIVHSPRVRPQWGSGNQVFFQLADTVWRSGSDRQFRVLTTLGEAP